MLSQRTTEYKSKKMKKRDNLDLARELRKLWNMKVTVVPLVIGALRTIPKGKGAGRVENWRTNRDYPNCDSIEIGQNTGKKSW